MNDIIVIGDVVWDNFLIIDEKEAALHCRKEDEKCELCFKFGQKIPVAKICQTVGGNAANASIGLAKLNLKTSIATNLARGKSKIQLIEYLKNHNVGTNLINLTADDDINYSTILVYRGERTILVHQRKSAYKLPNLPKTRWIYLTSLADDSSNSCQSLAKFVAESQSKLIFQPGTYQLKIGLEKIRPLIRQSEIFLANKEEYQQLLATNQDRPVELLQKIRQIGVKIAVLTDGTAGAYYQDSSTSLKINAWLGRKVVEPTGAGDAFASAFVAAVIFDLNPKEALRWGIVNAGSVVEQIGAHEGLLSKAEILYILKNKTSVPSAENID